MNLDLGPFKDLSILNKYLDIAISDKEKSLGCKKRESPLTEVYLITNEKIVSFSHKIHQDPNKFVPFSPMYRWFRFCEYRKSKEGTFDLYIRRQAHDLRIRERENNPFPNEIKEWVELNIRSAFPEYIFHFSWLGAFDPVPTRKIEGTDCFLAEDGLMQSDRGWIFEIYNYEGPARLAECWDRPRDRYLRFSDPTSRMVLQQKIRPYFETDGYWSDGSIITSEERKILEIVIPVLSPAHYLK